jgi:hypothetical protein
MARKDRWACLLAILQLGRQGRWQEALKHLFTLWGVGGFTPIAKIVGRRSSQQGKPLPTFLLAP